MKSILTRLAPRRDHNCKEHTWERQEHTRERFHPHSHSAWEPSSKTITPFAVIEEWDDSEIPVALGHEGAGVVVAVGRKVKKLKREDHVVLSCHSCGRCNSCRSGRPAYCKTHPTPPFRGREGWICLGLLPGERKAQLIGLLHEGFVPGDVAWLHGASVKHARDFRT
ncbi:MAG: hypothetical protein C4576_15910 [Desulfobacteraceae bacterium]|nr:MAG: hypothetical protein C4576_15910 [Desulfobacteraceae bacterium]